MAIHAAGAHHSFAMFDESKTLVLEGTVKEFQWTNPHCWIKLVVRNADGTEDLWSIEGASPNYLGRHGWKATSLKPGDAVAVTTHPLKIGKTGGGLISVKLPDGELLEQVPVAPNPDEYK
jgi:hypothetical protein